MVVQITLSPGEAATIREAATRAQVTIEDFLRGATLLYIKAANDPYFREGADRPKPGRWQPAKANIKGDAAQIEAFQEALRHEGEKAFRASKELELTCQTDATGYVTNVVLKEADGAGVLVFDFKSDAGSDRAPSAATARPSKSDEEPGDCGDGPLGRASRIGKLSIEGRQRAIEQ